MNPDVRVIYDLGANIGGNLNYFLLKGDFVVAVEANPILCKVMAESYDTAIKSGRLVIENIIISKEGSSTPAIFYINKNSHLLSQFPKPRNLKDFDEILVPRATMESLVQKYGAPYYIKIDVEHYDAEILESLFIFGIYPRFISAEAHSLRVLALLVGFSKYTAFKLIDGPLTSEKSFKQNISVNGEEVIFEFPQESSGPFGDDLGSGWLTPKQLVLLVLITGTGWKDIHASSVHAANGGRIEMVKHIFFLCGHRLMRSLRSLIPKPLRFKN